MAYSSNQTKAKCRLITCFIHIILAQLVNQTYCGWCINSNRDSIPVPVVDEDMSCHMLMPSPTKGKSSWSINRVYLHVSWTVSLCQSEISELWPWRYWGECQLPTHIEEWATAFVEPLFAPSSSGPDLFALRDGESIRKIDGWRAMETKRGSSFV